MKKNILFSAITSSIALFSVVSANAQSVGVGTTTPSPRAALEVKQGASPQGLLIPKMSTTNMNALRTTLVGPQDLGMMIYNTDSSAFLYWDGIGFRNFGSSSVTPWAVLGPDIAYPSGNVMIGTNTPTHTLTVNGDLGVVDAEVSGYLDVTGDFDVLGLTTLGDLDVVGSVVIDKDLTLSKATIADGNDGMLLVDGSGLVSKLNFPGTLTTFLRADGSWAPVLGDNLGNHVATKNIAMKNFWVSGDGTDNGIFVSATNQIGIGTTSTNGRLNVITNGGTELFFDSPLGEKANIQCKQAIVLETLTEESLHFATNATLRMEIDGVDGNVAIGGAIDPNFKLYVYGKLKSDGITEISDRRLKTDITTLNGSLEKLGQLRGVSYNWIQNNEVGIAFEKDLQIGLIAQEVEAIFPELVDTDSNGYKSVEYSKLVAVLIEAIKDQQKQISQLQEQSGDLDEVKAEVESLKATLSKYSVR